MNDYTDAINLMIKKDVREQNRNMQQTYLDAAKRSAELINKLSNRLKEVDPDPSHPISAELFTEAAIYCNILTGYVDDFGKYFNIHMHNDVYKDGYALNQYANAKSKSAGWGVETKKKKRKKK